MRELLPARGAQSLRSSPVHVTGGAKLELLEKAPKQVREQLTAFNLL